MCDTLSKSTKPRKSEVDSFEIKSLKSSSVTKKSRQWRNPSKWAFRVAIGRSRLLSVLLTKIGWRKTRWLTYTMITQYDYADVQCHSNPSYSQVRQKYEGILTNIYYRNFERLFASKPFQLNALSQRNLSTINRTVWKAHKATSGVASWQLFLGFEKETFEKRYRRPLFYEVGKPSVGVRRVS